MLGRLRTVVVLAALAVAAASAGVFSLPPLDRDEARFAQASVQMAESGDYVRIYFQDQPRNKKPAGIYWLQATAVKTFSDPDARAIWAYRLPSVLGLVIAVLATYWAGCILAGRTAGFAGAAFLAVSVLAGVEGGIAKTDAMLLGMTTLAMASLAALYERKSAGVALLFWIAMAFGVLIKGPITPMVAGLTILVLMLIDRKAGWLMRVFWSPGLVIAVALVGGWIYLVQTATDGAFLAEALGQDLAPKLVSGHESHGAPPGAYLIMLPFLFFPGVLFLLPGLMATLKAFFRPYSDHEAAGLRFLGAWAIPSWIVFELLPTKLAHYVLPLYPALALMAGAAVAALMRRRILVMSKLVSVLLFAAVGGAYAAAIILLPDLIASGVLIDPDFDRLSETAQSIPPLRLLLPGVIAGVLLLAPLFLWRAPMAVVWLVIAVGLGFHWQTRAVLLPSIEPLWVSARISEELAAQSLHPRLSPLAKPPLVSAGYAEPSLVFLTDTGTVLTDGVEAARLAGAEIGRATLVESREREAFEAELEAIGANAVIMVEIDGVNYSIGEPVSIAIYRTTERARNPIDADSALR